MFPVDLLVGSLRQSSGWWRVAHLVLTLPALTRISDRLIFYQPSPNQQLINKIFFSWNIAIFEEKTSSFRQSLGRSTPLLTLAPPEPKCDTKTKTEVQVQWWTWVNMFSLVPDFIYVGCRFTEDPPTNTPQVEFGWVVANRQYTFFNLKKFLYFLLHLIFHPDISPLLHWQLRSHRAYLHWEGGGACLNVNSGWTLGGPDSFGCSPLPASTAPVLPHTKLVWAQYDQTGWDWRFDFFHLHMPPFLIAA